MGLIQLHLPDVGAKEQEPSLLWSLWAPGLCRPGPEILFLFAKPCIQDTSSFLGAKGGKGALLSSVCPTSSEPCVVPASWEGSGL